jgi:hypothetical protein
MENLPPLAPTAEPYRDVPLGAEAFVLHLVLTERNDHEDRAEPRQTASLDAWRG